MDANDTLWVPLIRKELLNGAIFVDFGAGQGSFWKKSDVFGN
jgi:hypothetical protein